MPDKQKKKMLITGASGILGSNLAFFFKDHFAVTGVYHAHAVAITGVVMVQADLCSGAEADKVVCVHDPDIIIHCAAQANVDLCEADPAAAHLQNVQMTRNIVNALRGRDGKLVFISTDLVYGPSSSAHKEEETLLPCNEYGRTKVLAEEVALKKAGTLVLRTNLFGWSVGGRKSLAEWVIESLGRHMRIQGFKDVFFSSIYTFDLADILYRCLQNDLSGIFNLGASTSLSKYEFLKQIGEALQLDVLLIDQVSVNSVTLQATRNKNIMMDVHKLSSKLGLDLPTTERSIEHFVRDYHAGIQKLIQGR